MATKRTAQEITFKDIARLTDREIQMVLREIDSRDLALSLKGATDKLKGRIFANMSERVGGLIRDEMEFAGRKAGEDVKAVQLGITEVLEKLRKAGLIEWPRPAKPAKKAKSKLSKEYLAIKRLTEALAKCSLFELSLEEVNRMFVGLAEIARREGILALDNVMKDAGDPFAALGVGLATDGTEPELLQTILETWKESLLREQEVKYRKVLEGIMSIQSGDNPRIVEQKLGVLY